MTLSVKQAFDLIAEAHDKLDKDEVENLLVGAALAVSEQVVNDIHRIADALERLADSKDLNDVMG